MGAPRHDDAVVVEIRRLAEQGRSAQQIADEMGLGSRMMVLGLAFRNGVKLYGKPPKFPWLSPHAPHGEEPAKASVSNPVAPTRVGWSSSVEAKKAYIEHLVGKGLSASQIADEMVGASRSSVLGFMQRQGIESANPRARPPVINARAAAAPRPKASVARPRVAPSSAPAAAPTRKPNILRLVAEAEAEPLPDAVRLIDLTPSMCRWPLGDPASENFRFCGAKKFREKPYCAGHCRLAYSPPRVRVSAKVAPLDGFGSARRFEAGA